MIVTFCGHSRLNSGFDKNKMKERIVKTIENNACGSPVVFYLGGYGEFDYFALSCCREYQRSYKESKCIFVTPYIHEDYLKLIDKTLYDEIVYSDIEGVPYKFAISKRNEWMIDKADLVVAYVKHDWGGAYNTLRYAKRKKKNIVEL